MAPAGQHGPRPLLQLAAAAVVAALAVRTAATVGVPFVRLAARAAPAPRADPQTLALARYHPLREKLQGVTDADYLQDTDADPLARAPDAAAVHAQLALAPTILWRGKQHAVVVLDLADPALVDAAVRRHGLRSAEPAGAGLFLCRR
jgi:hypothetical protein